MNFKRFALLLMVSLVNLTLIPTNSVADQIDDILKEKLVSEFEVHQLHREFVRKRLAKLKLANSAKQWQVEAQILRERLLENVVLKGVPSSWRNFKTKVVLQDKIPGDGYHIQKLKYEALPGFWIPALLYVPESVQNDPGTKVPVVLNLNGHDGSGKAATYKQKRCIHLAKNGVLNLNVEWLGMGQFRQPNFSHPNLKKLDLCGCSGVSLFYYSMSRGLDVLLGRPEADPERVAVTGLSGGGWQTIFISSLDTRVTCCIPVAGYSSLVSRLERDSDIGDQEQVPVDMMAMADYTHLTALLAPRPALLIYNDKDNCCFISKFTKPGTFDPVVPFYRQASVPENFQFYENSDPGSHNYQLDNRNQLYQFLNRHFFKGETTIPVEPDNIAGALKYEDLVVELPDNNAGFNTFAKELSVDLPQQKDMPGKYKRIKLKEILKIKEGHAEISKIKASKTDAGVNLMQFTLKMNQDFQVPVVVATPENSTGTILLLADQGYSGLSDQVRKLLKQKIQIVLCDPLFIGQNNVKGVLYQQELLINTVAKRPLGLQAEQVLHVVRSLTEVIVSKKVEIHGMGLRSGLIALCAAAIDENHQLSATVSDEFPESLKHFLKADAQVTSYPEFYTFGLLEYFDLDDLRRLANQD